MKPKELTQEQIAKISAGATARGQDGVGMVQGGIQRPQHPIDPPLPVRPWMVLSQLR